MIHFLLCIKKKVSLTRVLEIQSLIEFGTTDPDPRTNVLFANGNFFLIHKEHENRYGILIGDLIPPEGIGQEDYLHSLIKDFKPNKLKETGGHFYLIFHDTKAGKLQVFNSLFSILPIYYAEETNRILVSSNAGLIKTMNKDKYQFNKRFLLEMVLFNYQFFNQSVFCGIYLLPSNSYATILGDGIAFTKHTRIEDYFTSSPSKVKNSLDHLSDLFIARTKQYFPDKIFLISFTGGFDGRTLVSCASRNHAFDTFSFGTSTNPDIMIPENNASSMGFKHHRIMLDDENYRDAGFHDSGEELIRETDSTSSYIYSHFVYAARCLQKQADYLINGFFGSELFRAIHLTGAVSSPVLLDYFRSDNLRLELIRDQMNCRLKYLQFQAFREEVEHLMEDLQLYKKNLDGTCNQQFYVFVFEEIFRKFFGPLIFAQMNYFNVRSPYLDFTFIRELLLSNLAGVNNPFYTHNPVKRMKGQLLYADIIRKTSKKIFYQKTGKGYRPADILVWYRISNILAPFAIKRIKRRLFPDFKDPLGIATALKKSDLDRIHSNLIALDTLVDVNRLLEDLNHLDLKSEESKRDTIAQILSLSAYLKMI